MLYVLNEKNVVVVSESIEKTTFFLSSIISLIKPFEWAYPIIYNLPEDCLVMINSPVPVVIGLVMNSKDVMNKIIPSSVNQDNLFIFMDQKLFYLE